ncbi:MAG: hypothetical protein KDB03_16015 [Planctomycetales bacterium]|nr:hypothetical protein [Planctomycetales bacterium]
MRTDPANNEKSSADADSDLKAVFQCSRIPSFASVDIDAVLQETSVRPVSTHVTESSCDVRLRKHLAHPISKVFTSRKERKFMLGRASAFGVCAAGLLVALLLCLWGDKSALAQVQDALKRVKTASYTMTQTVGDQPPRTWNVMLLGNNLCRVDQPNGIYLVFDLAAKKMVDVNPGESKALIIENLAVPNDYNVLAMLTELNRSAAKEQPGLPIREIGGVTAVGIVVEDSGITYNAYVDPKTNLPLEMEGERMVSFPDGQGGVKEQLVKELWTTFIFDEPLDEKLFSMQLPEGYSVEIRQAPTSSAAEEKDRAARQRQLQEAAADRAKQENVR